MNLPRMSPASEQVLAAAAMESADLGNAWLGVEHFFLGLAVETPEQLERVFADRDVTLAEFTTALRGRVATPGASSDSGVLTFTKRGRDILRLAGRIAGQGGQAVVEPAHILESIFREGRNVPVRLMSALGLDVPDMHAAIGAGEAEPEAEETPTPLLARYGRDLTRMAQRGRLSPVIGRERELDFLAQVLLRRNKNNPVLVGEAGVGKTAIVEGFAQRMASPQAPAPLRKCRIIELSVGSLVAGTKFRGEFEERILGIINEAAQNPDIVLFLDELHTLVGAGASGGDSLDASNIMKPALARGDIRCIGATTVEEYRRFIEKDPALDRRFDRVLVEEPTPKETLSILSGLRGSLEAHHQAAIAPGALEAAIHLTVRHVPDRQLPDKAIDALDQTCARKRLESYAGGARADAGRIAIAEADVVTTVARWTGIPLERLTRESSAGLLDLEEKLKARVIGQDHAVGVVARAMLTQRAGLAAPNRPLGVFLFMGPTGVGKTELARSLAELMFGDEKRLVRFDMSEYMEPHSAAKLIGAPPGYVGYEKEGLLISALRTRPHCIVLFDEIEKAHQQVFDLFLQIFDEGRLSGAQGRTADFTQAVVILTSNLRPSWEPPKRELGFHSEDRETAPPVIDMRAALSGFFRPELVNRIDEIVAFRPLSRESLARIVERYITGIRDLLEPRRMKLELDDAVHDLLIEQGDGNRYGARELRRVVDRLIRQPLAREILARSGDGGTVRVGVADGELRFHWDS